MNFGELFAGIGGFAAGLERAGHRCAFQCELDPFCTRVLAERWPVVPRHRDVRTIALAHATGEQQLERVDLLVGGFPCQGASVAGKRLGLADDRTALFWEIIRIQKIVRAPWALLENVPGLRSVRFGHDFATCLAALKELWPVVGWRTFDSRFFHVAQRRERVFFVCGPTEAGVASVLFEPEGGSGHLAAGGEAGAGIARCLATGTNGARYDGDTENFVTFEGRNAHAMSSSVQTLKATPSTHRDGNPLIFDTTQVTSAKNYSNPKPGDPCHPLAEGAHPPLLIATHQNTGHGWWNESPIAQAIRTPDGGGSLEANLVTHAPSAESADAGEDGTGLGTPLDRAPRQSIVRRLTPLEAERLQNFPDGWTCLCQPLSAYAADPDAAALACTCPDSPRYRALGNAVTTSVIYWIGRRLAAQEGC